MPGVGNPRAARPDRTSTTRAPSRRSSSTPPTCTNRLREVFDTVNRNNTSIYAVDPRGLAAFEYDINQGVSLHDRSQYLNDSIDSLRVLADNTDGRAIVNRNDLAAGMKQIMRDASGYYLLGYTSSSAPTDGKFHTIDVQREAARRRGPRAQGLLGLHRGGRGARERAAEARPAAGDLRTRSTRSPSRPTAAMRRVSGPARIRGVTASRA